MWKFHYLWEGNNETDENLQNKTYGRGQLTALYLFISKGQTVNVKIQWKSWYFVYVSYMSFYYIRFIQIEMSQMR